MEWSERILEPGKTCWRSARAREVSFLVDASAYFEALADALSRARHSVYLLGWEIHSRLRLRPGDPSSPPLGALLSDLARGRRGLHVHVLVWDHPLVFALEREWLPIYNLGAGTHRRVHFHQDARHPVGASHHQKLVVIDDAVAFCGGIDLTARRWDTPEHRPGEPARVDPDGRSFPPFHDVQVAVAGPVAAALGDLARDRWRRATGREPRGPVDASGLPALRPDLRDVEVAVVRTDPGPDGGLDVREIEQHLLAAIGAARRSVYVESQYLTASRVVAALAARLSEPDGPEVVLIGPRSASGWLEEKTMGAERARLLRALREADRNGRLGCYFPRSGADDVYVHSKLVAVDDRFISLGSANLSNRSMGLDTECNLAFEARREGDPVARAVGALRARLLGEHLGVPPERVEEVARARGSIVAAVEALRGGPRTLEPLPAAELDGSSEALAEVGTLVDPEGPLRLEAMAEEVVPEEIPRRGPRVYRRLALVLAVLVALAVAWRVGDGVDAQRLVEWSAPLARSWWGPPVSVGIFVAGSIVFLPVTALVLHASLLYGPWTGFVTAMAGGVAAASATYGLGRVAGRDLVRRLAGRRLNRISRSLARRGVLAVIAVRLVPIAPFTAVNMVAGASHIRFRDFLLGTALGMAPGVVALTLLGDRLGAALRDPTPTSLVVLGAVAIGAVAGLAALSRWLARRSGRER